jgi:hypothetical protein
MMWCLVKTGTTSPFLPFIHRRTDPVRLYIHFSSVLASYKVGVIIDRYAPIFSVDPQ